MHDALGARRFLWFPSLNCGHSARMAPRQVVRFLRDDVLLEELRHKMKCGRCRQRRLAPNSPDDFQFRKGK